MVRLLFALALLLGLPGAGFAQPRPADSSLWQRSGERITFNTARFSFPVEAGAVRLAQAAEFSDHGGGRDSGLQYFSEDEEIFATVYVYYPGLPHAGLTAFATDTAIRLQSDFEPAPAALGHGQRRRTRRHGHPIRLFRFPRQSHGEQRSVHQGRTLDPEVPRLGAGRAPPRGRGDDDRLARRAALRG